MNVIGQLIAKEQSDGLWGDAYLWFNVTDQLASNGRVLVKEQVPMGPRRTKWALAAQKHWFCRGGVEMHFATREKHLGWDVVRLVGDDGVSTFSCRRATTTRCQRTRGGSDWRWTSTTRTNGRLRLR